MNGIANIPSAFQSATNTIRRAQENVDKDAGVIASSTIVDERNADARKVDARETVNALVDSRQQVLYTQAAARIIRATDAMTKTLLDVHA
jgi:adenylate kinase